MRLATAIVILSLVTPAMAQETRPTLMMGIGRLSCATWLADPYSENEGSAWLLGYWSAANIWGAVSDVGASTDALGIIESIKNICRDDPATTLVNAAGRLYAKFRQEGR